MLTIEVAQGEEVLSRVRTELAARSVVKGAIVSVIGAVDHCEVSTMPKGDAGSDVIRTYTDPLEMFGTGEVRDGVPHIHAVFGTEDGSAVSGHLHAATVGHWFVRVYVIADQ
ncbi:PCC domain-containing protein [Streptomyces sp. NPDC005533]|uniref:PCC domain-containing protein n=1 Tax=Streptomyces sp. NPDC005533 TaxID=3364723 RepID=UPI0036A8E4D2